nr:hypothetical protein CFP56_05833 [Quercus suber]
MCRNAPAVHNVYQLYQCFGVMLMLCLVLALILDQGLVLSSKFEPNKSNGQGEIKGKQISAKQQIDNFLWSIILEFQLQA